MATQTPDATADPRELGFDPDALRWNYREERDRRIRPDGKDPYIEVEGVLQQRG
jgi:hypothetical protein